MNIIRGIAALSFVLGNFAMGGAFIYFGLSFITNVKYASEIQAGVLLFYVAAFVFAKIMMPK